MSMTDISPFLIEDVETQSLSGGIKKKFTSLATNATIFRWKFGDETYPATYLETTENPIYHTYKHKGTYTVSHQSCYPCIATGTLACSVGWCVKTIEALPPKPPMAPLLLFGGFLGLMVLRKRCDELGTKKECDRYKECQWISREKICAPICEEGYRLEKARIDGMKRPTRLECRPIKKLSTKKQTKA